MNKNHVNQIIFYSLQHNPKIWHDEPCGFGELIYYSETTTIITPTWF
jgi:hypothetical protein